MSETRWVHFSRGKAHALFPHGKGTLCGRCVSEDAVEVAADDADKCARCNAKATRRAESAAKWRGIREAHEARTEQNRKGRFVVYRCTLCGSQHGQPGGRGVPWCMSAHHAAKLEAIEVQGPAFAGEPRSKAAA